MAITKVSNNLSFKSAQAKNKFNKPNYVKITGYGALVSGMVSILAIKTKKPKMHREFALLASVFSLAHVAILEWYKHWHKNFQ